MSNADEPHTNNLMRLVANVWWMASIDRGPFLLRQATAHKCITSIHWHADAYKTPYINRKQPMANAPSTKMAGRLSPWRRRGGRSPITRSLYGAESHVCLTIYFCCWWRSLPLSPSAGNWVSLKRVQRLLMNCRSLPPSHVYGGLSVRSVTSWPSLYSAIPLSPNVNRKTANCRRSLAKPVYPADLTHAL